MIGVDLQNVVQKKYCNFKFQVADATKLPFQNNNFDLIISFDVIERIKRDKRVMVEIYQKLKKNGKIFLGTPNKNRLFHFLLKLLLDIEDLKSLFMN